MPQQEFDNSKDTRLGGLWLHANGRYYEGSIEIGAQGGCQYGAVCSELCGRAR